MSTLRINSLKYEDILHDDFNNLTTNNEIVFSHQGFAVVYGPNGAGKTTIANAFSCEKEDSHYDVEIDGNHIVDNRNYFHVIKEQRNRNIIKGETEEFILGDDIRREKALKDQLDSMKSTITDRAITFLKNFGITSKSSKAFDLLRGKHYIDMLKDFVNKQSKGKQTTFENIIAVFSQLHIHDVEETEISEEKLSFLITDIGKSDSVIKKIEQLHGVHISQNSDVVEIERSDDAIKILEKYRDLDHCVVCDTQDINPDDIAENKRERKQSIIDLLDEQIKEILNSIQSSNFNSDPFCIKQKIIRLCETADTSIIDNLISDINEIREYYVQKLENHLFNDINENNISELFNQYSELRQAQVELTEDDILYIKQIINENIRSELDVRRDNSGDIKIYIGDNQLTDEVLPLSTGEQNFISLSFELLKAKNDTNSSVVVLDDPISSFDSIYKNKIVFAILQILSDKLCVVLTHNIDMLRLLEAQYSHSYSLYLFYNSPLTNNGFIKVNNSEKELLLHLDKLINFLRSSGLRYVRNFELFFKSVVPFMRGVAHITYGTVYEGLTGLMHGYKTDLVDIKSYYHTLFGAEIDAYYNDAFNCRASDIIETEISIDTEIIDKTSYPMLNQTLIHSLAYLQARLTVEKTLVEKYNINTDENEQLGKIIDAAFPRNNTDTIKFRVALTSKKTLINEFNHFEGNLSIFYPAMDISTQVLLQEKEKINELMSEIERL